MKKDNVLHIRINSVLLEQLKQLAKEQNRSLSNLVETIIRKEIEMKEGEAMKEIDNYTLIQFFDDELDIELKDNEIILEKAYVSYDKDGNYHHTVDSEYYITTEQYAKDHVMNNIENNYEYYFYKTSQDLKDNSHYDVIIANEVLNKGDEE